MKFLFAAASFIGSFFSWIVEKAVPYLAKKIGIGAAKYATQNLFSLILYFVVFAYWTASVYFITESYRIFRDFLDLISNPTANTQFGSSQYLECFMNLLQSSGIATGFNAAISFTMLILLFMFSVAVYSSATITVKRISDEVFKNIKLF